MIKKLIQFSLLAIFVVGATYFSVKVWVDGELKGMPPPAKFIRELTPEEYAKVYLYNLILEKGLRYRDFAILREVIGCESAWRHYLSNGKVIMSSGNVGFGQINHLAWYEFFQAKGLSIYGWEDNIRATVWLYQNYGLKPWQKWSGNCWLPKIAVGR